MPTGPEGDKRPADVTSRWLIHTQTTEPASFGLQVERLPADVTSLSRSVQKLLVHTDCLKLYGLNAGSMANISRTTLPVSERLGKLAAFDQLDLAEGRPPAGRQVGTCRDFALLLCSFLRTHAIPARVRCGFASYFGADWWDHWICEYWDHETSTWFRADAELDETMCGACGITFDTLNMPQGAFLTAGEAWLECRSEHLSPEIFGHGEHRGLWFMSVNVVRDSLSLSGQEMSAWDTWREAPPESRRLSAGELLRTDEFARHPEHLPGPQTPPWQTPPSTPVHSS